MARGRPKQIGEAEAEDTLNKNMIESGERDKLRAKLNHLLEDCGWREQVKLQVRETVSERGMENVTMEDLVQEMAPRATGLVPDKVKKELMRDMQRFLERNAKI